MKFWTSYLFHKACASYNSVMGCKQTCFLLFNKGKILKIIIIIIIKIDSQRMRRCYLCQWHETSSLRQKRQILQLVFRALGPNAYNNDAWRSVYRQNLLQFIKRSKINKYPDACGYRGGDMAISW